jgi:hypothetical protein
MKRTHVATTLDHCEHEYLAKQAGTIRRRSRKFLGVSAMLRAAIGAMREAQVDLTDCSCEQDVRRLLAARFRGVN